MSLSMTELHDFRATDRETFPAAPLMLDLMPYRNHGTRGYEAPFDSPISGERMYSYTAVHGYQSTHEHASSTTHASRHCDEKTPVSTAGTIEPFHLNPFLQNSPRTAFEDSRGTFQLLNAGQYYVDSDPIPNSAYQLDEGFHALEQPRFSSTSTFETMQHGLYQTPYSDSVTPSSGSPSPIAVRSRTHGNTLEGLSRGEDATVGGEDIEEDDAGSDKPYARLIWEALMQAPGHRMMLREIYAWFQCNTNKAKESGSNGWQNSIRHNLSMNQAFENDKSDSSTSRGQAKKANSVWVLTENAIKDGVQSTTRYRKTGSSKKTHTSRTPAPLRQRSGARGGRAARRAARLRRNEQDRFSDGLLFPGIPSPPDSYGSIGMDGTTNDADFMSIHTPTTPTNDLSYSFSAALTIPKYPTEMPLFYNGEEDYQENGASVQHEFVMQPQKDPCSDGMEHFPYGSNPQEMSM